MPREIDDSGDGIRWTCAQAYEGLRDNEAAEDAALVDGTDRYRVVCTPSGGSRSVELQLPEDWENRCSDEELLELIRRNQK
ncbi:hypothetical protein BH23GEM6_BH23GEM6_24650 [soil metagenome]